MAAPWRRSSPAPTLRPAAVPPVHPCLEAVGEAFGSGVDPVPAAHAAGGALAREGWAMDAALDALHDLHGSLVGGDPRWDVVRALGAGWGEAALALVHGTSCEDPLTGLAGPAHLRTRVAELLRGGPGVAVEHALLVVEEDGSPEGGDPLARGMRRVHLGQQVRTVVPGDAVVADLGPRLVVLLRRDDRLHRRAALLRRLVAPAPRTWVEPVPATPGGAAALLADLALA